MVCDNRKVAVQVSTQVRNILDVGRTRKCFLFKLDAKVLKFCQRKRFQRRIVVGIAFQNLCRSRQFEVNLLGPLRMANGILDSLRNRFLGQAFRVRITRTAILNHTNAKPYGIRNFGILHLALENRQPLGMGIRSNHIKLFRLTLREVTHTRNCVNNIHSKQWLVVGG